MSNRRDLRGKFFEQVRIFRLRVHLRILNHFVKLICVAKGVKLGKRDRFIGYPLISRVPYSQISIADDCLFNSARNSVRVGLSRRCSFVTLGEEAKIQIGKNSGGTGVTIAARTSISIGNNVLLGLYCNIFDTDFHNADPYSRESEDKTSRPVTIEDNVFIGANSFVLKGVTIGENSIIGANSVVVSSIPPNSIALGNPCKVLIRRKWK